MKTCVILLTTVITAVCLINQEAGAVDYDQVLRSLEQLDSSIQVIKQHYAVRGHFPRQYASTDKTASPKDFNRDVFYDFAINLENTVDDLQELYQEARLEDAERPENPADIKHGKIALGGFLHEQYYDRTGDDEQSTFLSKRARLSVTGDLNEYTKLKLVGEFAGSPELHDGVLTLSPNEYWSIQFGQYKPPFGTEFLTSSTALPFVCTSMGKSLGTDGDIGTSVTYRHEVDKDLKVEFCAGVFNGAGPNQSDANSHKNFVGRMKIGIARYFTVAPNFITGKTNEADNPDNLNTYGGSVTWSWKDEIIEGEYIYSKVGEIEKAGWYIWGGHSFNTQWRFLPVVQVLARYEQYDADLDIAANMVNRVTVGTNLFIDKKYTKIQLNYQINGEEEVSVDNNEFLANFQVAF